MGLFSSLFSGKKETKSETLKNERGAYELKMWQFFPWDLPEPEKHIELTGKSVSKIYVYNAEPLDVELEEYQFELARGDYEMLSLYTETSWNSSYNGDIAVLFENQPIGFVELPRDLIKQLMEKGYTFSITAYQDGWWSDEVPDLKAKVPNEEFLLCLINPERKNEMRAQFDSSYGDFSYAEQYTKTELQHPRIVFAETENSPKGKPSVVVFDGDRAVAELTPRMQEYQKFSKFVNKRIKSAVYEKHGGKKPRVTMEFVFLKK